MQNSYSYTPIFFINLFVLVQQETKTFQIYFFRTAILVLNIKTQRKKFIILRLFKKKKNLFNSEQNPYSYRWQSRVFVSKTRNFTVRLEFIFDNIIYASQQMSFFTDRHKFVQPARKMGRKSSELSNDVRKLIVGLHNDGKSLRDIAKIVKRSASTIQYIIKIYKNSGRVGKKKRNENRLKLNRRHRSFLLRQIRKKPGISGVELSAILHKYFGIKVTAQTVRNHVRRLGFKSRVAVRKPFVSRINRQKRIIFAKTYLKKTMRFWNRVIFSDECKFNVKISDGRVKIWREANTSLKRHNLLPTFKHGGGSLMVWGCFGASGVGKLHFIDGIMNARQYINILKMNLSESARILGHEDDYIFQQDNDPKHTALDTRLWILYNTPLYLKTPPQSPDINPIENLWSIFKKKLKYYEIRNIEGLKQALRTEWAKIPQTLTKKLVESMPARLNAVLKQKGYPTKY